MTRRRGYALVPPVALLLALPACFDPVIPVGLPCAPDRACPDGQRCELGGNVCLVDDDDAWRDDTSADFQTAGATFEGAAVEAPGVIAPVPYLTGGLLLRGARGIAFTDPGTVGWEVLTALTITGEGVLRSTDYDRGTGRPLGVGLTGAADVDDVTLLFEGEILLPAGTVELRMTANDRGFVELGGGLDRRLVSTGALSPVTALTVPADGWYPIRGAVVDSAAALSLRLEHRVGGSTYRPFDRERLRTAIGARTGLVVDGFSDPAMIDPTATSLGAVIAAPTSDDLEGGERYSLRFSGQLRIDVPGAYRFQVDSRGGHRAWIDGTPIADAIDALVPVTQTAPIQLGAGWHDLVVDYDAAAESGARRIALAVLEGPELAGAPIPRERLRPVIGRSVRWSSRYQASLPIPDQGTHSEPLTLEGPADAVGRWAELVYDLSHPALATLRVTLDPPDAPPLVLHEPGTGSALSGSGAYSGVRRLDAAALGVAGDWALVVTDTVAGGTGQIDFCNVAVTYRGGVAPFPTTSRYTSGVRDLDRTRTLGPARWGLRQAEAGAARVSIRTCDLAEACAQQPWIDVASSGDTPAVPPGRFAQYQVELSSNGELPTALDWIELAFVAP